MLAGKGVFITGANRGIGEAIARVFAQQGATLYLAARNESSLNTLADSLHSDYGVAVHGFALNVKQPQQVKETFQALHRQKRPLDVLVNNAGVLDDALLPMIAQQSVEDVYATNVHG